MHSKKRGVKVERTPDLNLAVKGGTKVTLLTEDLGFLKGFFFTVLTMSVIASLFEIFSDFY